MTDGSVKINKAINKTSVGAVDIIVTVVSVFMIFMLAAFPERYIKTTFTGLSVWALNVLPSLLPFFFLTALTTKNKCLSLFSAKLSPLTRVLYRSEGVAAYVQIMSFLSGYPIGAKMISDLKAGGVIDEKDATKLSTFCSTSGPMFIVGSVGTGMFKSGKTGLILLSAHLISSILCGIIFRFLPHDKRACARTEIKKCDNVLYESVYSSVVSVAVIGGFIAIFYTFSQIVTDLKIFLPLSALLTPLIGENNANGVCLSIIECTFACKTFAEKITPLSTALACAAVSFGGLSVWCQSAAYLIKAKAKFSVFALSKIVHTVCSFAVCYALLAIFGP